MEFNTDKFTHGFIPFYEKYFNQYKNAKNILEIGIYNGESLKYLNHAFPEATIYGIDIEDKKQYDTDKIKTFICNQESREDLMRFLETVMVDFDIIIDDGGHTMKQQQISFGFLFKHLKKGGLYILEDLHTSRLKGSWGWIFESDLITTLDMLNNFDYTKKIISNHINDEEKKTIEKETESIEIWTRTPFYNESVTSVIKKSNLPPIEQRDEILFICLSHQDSQDKVDYVIENLKKIKSYNFDICFTTHSNFGLTEISNYCNYIVYDSDNSFPTDKDFFENLKYISPEKLDGYLSIFYRANQNLQLINFFHPNHSKSAHVNLKNGLKIAKQMNYKWFVIFEYDNIIPDIDLKVHFENKINLLDKLKKDAYLYYPVDLRGPGMLFPYMLLSKTSLLDNSEYMNVNWETSTSEFFKMFGNKCGEQITYDLFKPNLDKCILHKSTKINEDFSLNLTDMTEIHNYHLHNSIDYCDESYINKFFNVGIYPLKKNNQYNLQLYITIINESEGYNINNLNVTLIDHEKEISILNLYNINVDLRHWQMFNILDFFDPNPDDNRKIKLNYNVKLPSGKIKNEYFTMDLSEIEKYYSIKRLEII